MVLNTLFTENSTPAHQHSNCEQEVDILAPRLLLWEAVRVRVWGPDWHLYMVRRARIDAAQRAAPVRTNFTPRASLVGCIFDGVITCEDQGPESVIH